jgi:hypothetical protein
LTATAAIAATGAVMSSQTQPVALGFPRDGVLEQLVPESAVLGHSQIHKTPLSPCLLDAPVERR